MSQIAELLIPSVRWEPQQGFERERPRIERALELGVGGFILLGGTEADVRNLTKELRQRSRIPLLIGAELERGAAQQFDGTTGLPPIAALAALSDIDVLRRAAKLTAREARTIGVNWNFAPVCDLDLQGAHRPLGSDVVGGASGSASPRSLGAEPQGVGRMAAAWIEACQHEGVLACARHFPGIGRVPHHEGVEEHEEAHVVDVPRRVLLENDVVPFRSAIGAQVATMMAAHVAYPALDASRAPATMSTQVLRYLLREKFGFDGLIAADWRTMHAADTPESEARLAVRALDAGCDLLLCPNHIHEVVAVLEDALRDGPLDDDRILQSRRRRSKWAQWAAPPTEYRRASGSDIAWAAALNERVVHLVRGQRPSLGPVADVVLVDDGTPGAAGGAHAQRADVPALGGPVQPFVDALRAGPARVQVSDTPSAAFRGAVVVALLGGSESTGYARATREALDRVIAAARSVDRPAVVVQFGHPALADDVALEEPLVSAWSGDRWMQEAAARWLLKRD
jgi:beta-glucosidase